jgi:hypothetical protein
VGVNLLGVCDDVCNWEDGNASEPQHSPGCGAVQCQRTGARLEVVNCTALSRGHSVCTPVVGLRRAHCTALPSSNN